MAKVVVIGSCMIDLICYSARLPKCGETIHGTKFQRDFGGKGANQCVAAARLGAQTALVACLGNDVFGKEYLSHLQSTGIDTQHIRVVEDSSGIAQIAVADNGDNHIIIVAAANNHLNIQHIQGAHELLAQAVVALFQFETPVSTTLYALKYFKQHNLSGITIVNAAPANASVDDELFKYTDILCVNESEAQILSGLPTSTKRECEAALGHLLQRGCGTVIITLGKEGAMYASRPDSMVQYEAGAPVANPLDTTGAGDAFLGALAYLLAYRPHWPLERKVKVSCSVAAHSIMKRGTQASFPLRRDLPNTLFTD